MIFSLYFMCSMLSTIDFSVISCTEFCLFDIFCSGPDNGRPTIMVSVKNSQLNSSHTLLVKQWIFFYPFHPFLIFSLKSKKPYCLIYYNKFDLTGVCCKLVVIWYPSCQFLQKKLNVSQAASSAPGILLAQKIGMVWYMYFSIWTLPVPWSENIMSMDKIIPKHIFSAQLRQSNVFKYY